MSVGGDFSIEKQEDFRVSDNTTPLRQRMIQDMRIRGLGDKSRQAHIRAIRDLAGFLVHSPDTATPEDLPAYQLHMTDTEVSPSVYNARITALRFFFGMTCAHEGMKRFMRFGTESCKLTAVLNAEEVCELLSVAPGPVLKYRAALGISYGAGLRASEVCNLTTGDIARDRMLIHFVQGTVRKDRKVMLSSGLLDLLPDYWCEARPEGLLFTGKPRINLISPRQLDRAFLSARRMAGTYKPAPLHTLRHSFATYRPEAGRDVRLIQILPGHAKRGTTAQDTKVATKLVRDTTSPFEALKRSSLQARKNRPGQGAGIVPHKAGDCRHIPEIWRCMATGQRRAPAFPSSR
jgi:site-specific recombinase XerD